MLFRKIIPKQVPYDKSKRTVNGIEIFPAIEFLKALWDDEII